MRIVNIVFMLLMILFIAVQYNDPDGSLWILIYAVPAIWAAIAAFKSTWLVNKLVHALLLVCIAVAVAGIFFYWPETPGWWRQEVWWETETAREGMGMMIVAVVLAVVWLSRPRSQSADQFV